jgi:putative aldouronate transport system substrate-binding protein
VIGYNTLARDGVLLPLDDLLPKYAPNTWAFFKPEFWNGGRIDGKIYGVPAAGAFVMDLGVIVRKDLIEKYKFDVSTVKPGDWKALEPLWKAAKADGIIPFGDFGINSPGYGGYDILDNDAKLVVQFDDKTRKVQFYPETSQYKDAVTLMHEWYLAGYTYKDPSNNDENIANLQAGKVAAQWLGAVMKPGVVDVEWKPRIAGNNYDGVAISMTPKTFIPGSSFTQNVNSICKASKNPTVALQVLELLNSDAEFYNLIAIGIEGKHWVWDDQSLKVYKAGPNQADYSPGWVWEVGNMLLGYYPNKTLAQLKVWEETKKVNDAAPVSVMMGFAFNPEPVKTEYAAVVAAIKEADRDLGAADTGGRATDTPAALANLIKKAKDAGLDKVMAEAQKQVDAWAATQK